MQNYPTCVWLRFGALLGAALGAAETVAKSEINSISPNYVLATPKFANILRTQRRPCTTILLWENARTLSYPTLYGSL